MYQHGYNNLKSCSGRSMSLDPYSSYSMVQSYPRQPQPRSFTSSRMTNFNMRTPPSTRSSSDTYGRGTPASTPAKSLYDSKYSPRDRETSLFETSIQQSTEEYDDYSDGASVVTNTGDGIYDKESEVIIPRGDYQFGSVPPRTPKTPKFPPMASEPRMPTPGRISDKYPQWKWQMLPPTALLEMFPTDRPCCASHDTYCVKCTPELDLLTLRRSISDLNRPSPAKKKHAETYTKLIGGPPCSAFKSLGEFCPEMTTKPIKSTVYGESNSYRGSFTPRKTTKSITSSTNGEYGSEINEYDDYTTGVKNKSPSAAVTPWYTWPITSPILQASPGLRTVKYATPRTSKTPYGIAQARNGHPIYCILDTRAAVTTISTSILLKAFPGIKIIAHRSVSVVLEALSIILEVESS